MATGVRRRVSIGRYLFRKGNGIMADRSLPAQDSVAAQREFFRLAEQEHSLSIAVLAQRNKHLSKSTMAGWRDGAAMPAYALGELKLAGVPDDLLSLITKAYAVALLSEPDGEGDLDTAANDCLEFATEVNRAHHPLSPGGLAIVPQERVLIEPKRRRAAVSVRKAA